VEFYGPQKARKPQKKIETCSLIFNHELGEIHEWTRPTPLRAHCGGAHGMQRPTCATVVWNCHTQNLPRDSV